MISIINISVENRTEPITCKSYDGCNSEKLKAKLDQAYSKAPKVFELLLEANCSTQGKPIRFLRLYRTCRDVKMIHKHNISVRYQDRMMTLTAPRGTEISFMHRPVKAIYAYLKGDLKLSNHNFTLSVLNRNTPKDLASILEGLDLASSDEIVKIKECIKNLENTVPHSILHVSRLQEQVEKLYKEQFPSSEAGLYFGREEHVSAIKSIKHMKLSVEDAVKAYESLKIKINKLLTEIPDKCSDSIVLFDNSLKKEFVSRKGIKLLYGMVTEAVENKLHPKHKTVFELMKKYVSDSNGALQKSELWLSDDVPVWQQVAFNIWECGNNSLILNGMISYLRAHKTSERFASITCEEIFEDIVNNAAKRLENTQLELERRIKATSAPIASSSNAE